MTLLGPKRNACRQFTGGSFRVSLRLAPHPGHANAEGQVPVRARSRVKPTRPVAKGSRRNGRIPEVLDHLGNEMEKRLPIAMIVNLARAQNRNGTELTYTDNVSPQGACIVCNHPWQPGNSRKSLRCSIRSPCGERWCTAGNGATISTPSD